MTNLSDQGFVRGRGLGHVQVQENTLALAPPVSFFSDLADIERDRLNEGQMRVAVSEGNVYYYKSGEWFALSPLNLYGFREVPVADIDLPSELSQEVPRGKDREVVVARSGDECTVYCFDFGDVPSAAVPPYAIVSENADGFWYAIGGKYVAGGQSRLADTDGVLKVAADSVDGTALWIGGLLQYDVPLAPGTIADNLAKYVPSVSVPLLNNGVEGSLVLWTMARETTAVPERSAVMGDIALASGALVSFDPSLVPGIGFWFDSSQESSYTETAGLVSQITNTVNGSKNVGQNSGSLRPEKRSDIFAARLPGLVFDGTKRMLSSTSGWTGGSEILIAMAFRNTNILNGAGTRDGLFAIASDSSNHVSMATQANGGLIHGRCATPGGTVTVTLTGGNVPALTNNIAYLYVSSSQDVISVYLNGITVTTAFAQNAATISSSAVMHVGAWHDGTSITNSANCDFGDVIYVNANSITSGTISDVVSYLKTKHKATY